MSRLKTVKGIISTLWQMTKEDWNLMDHKLIRILTGVIGFAIATLFWYLFFRNITPF
ncbi:MAG: hypothetical protein NT129_04155 [Candidatus Aenigmarchaeota archaeon]|jgi:hypothetical protein|nr:hypothetical protein [Candidatus Aenigmarchaeota archaeon]